MWFQYMLDTNGRVEVKGLLQIAHFDWVLVNVVERIDDKPNKDWDENNLIWGWLGFN